MSNTVIRVENISKKYNLGNIGTGSLTRDLNRWWAGVRGKEDSHRRIGDKGGVISGEHWALNDVSFDIKQGEAVGIIGKNGAGKSTLLKILSRVTTPTSGHIKVKGRIASLLEVGTGFHPDLTGRENIFLNGAILGMHKAEIKAKFDEIVDFSGVEKYIDTPVKRYSSGMYVRLAFAVAAHLESEILILDEVLAVGDAEFQKKCLGKMGDVASKEGRTVLFVSHNIGAVKSLCNSGIILKDGNVLYQSGDINVVAKKYIENSLTFDTHIPLIDRKDRSGNGNIVLEDFQFLHSNGITSIELGTPIEFCFQYSIKKNNSLANFLISINNLDSQCILFLDSSTISDFPKRIEKSGKIYISLSNDFALPVGKYFINIAALIDGVMADYIQQAIIFDVVDGVFFWGGKIPIGKSLCFVKQKWSIE